MKNVSHDNDRDKDRDVAVYKLHPRTFRLSVAVKMHNHFGAGEPGYRFDGEKRIYTEQDLIPRPVVRPYADA